MHRMPAAPAGLEAADSTRRGQSGRCDRRQIH